MEGHFKNTHNTNTLHPIICKANQSNCKATSNHLPALYNQLYKEQNQNKEPEIPRVLEYNLFDYYGFLSKIEKGISIPNIPDISSDPKYSLENLETIVVHLCYICKTKKGITTHIRNSKTNSACLECYTEILGLETSQYDKAIKNLKSSDKKLLDYYANKEEFEKKRELFELDRLYYNLIYNLKHPKKNK